MPGQLLIKKNIRGLSIIAEYDIILKRTTIMGRNWANIYIFGNRWGNK